MPEAGEDDLLPCAFKCDWSKPVVSGHAIDPNSGLWLYAVRCQCGAQGPEHDSAEQAITAWNTRAQPSGQVTNTEEQP